MAFHMILFPPPLSLFRPGFLSFFLLSVECLPYVLIFSVLGFIEDTETPPVNFMWLLIGKDMLS